jgi:transcriptional regulator NrdR family protein
MKCVKCGGKTRVQESRAKPEGYYRRRFCVACGHSYVTVESDTTAVELSESMELQRRVAAAEIAIQTARSAMSKAAQKLRGTA